MNAARHKTLMTCRDNFYKKFYGRHFSRYGRGMRSFSKPRFDANAMRADRAFTVVSIFMTAPFARRRRGGGIGVGGGLRRWHCHSVYPS